MDVDYPGQLSYKRRTVARLLGRFGRIDPIVGMKDPLHYRCKVSNAFGYSRGRILSGVWQASGGRLVSVEGCALEDERAAPIVRAIKDLAVQFGLRTYDERTGKGLLRFVTLRIGKQTGQILVALGTGKGEFSHQKEFVKELIRRRPEITTVVRCVSTDRFNLVLGDQETVLYGPGKIVDRLCGLDFAISARSFFQINPTQTEVLYSIAVDLADLTPQKTVLDAYCGVGTIGMVASAKAGWVLGVELNADAVNNAKENVALNQLSNVEIYQGDAGEFMQSAAEEGEKIDVVFTDPPRAGCSRQFLSSLVRLSPEKIVYISCNPETQARDLRFLVQNGYRVSRIRPVDLFPYTRHIECVVCLTRHNELPKA